MAVLDHIIRFVAIILGQQRSRSEVKAAALRASFSANYRKFRALLTANNNALELITEMAHALDSGRPFGMTFVRSRCTALNVNVYKMIRSLQELSGGKYPGLTDSFKSVAGKIQDILDKQPPAVSCPFIMEMDDVDRNAADLVGEKMANLGEIRNRAGLAVPDGFVITASSSQHFLSTSALRDEINRRLTICNADDLEELYTTSAAIQQFIMNAPLPEDLALQIREAYERLAARVGARVEVAMRSSALGEDTGNASFAGQYRTQLNVSEDLLLETYKEIVAGKYKSQAIVYRLQRGFRHQDVIMCVGCLAMVDAKAGGVMYSRVPTDHRSSYAVISAALGAASRVVDGSVATDMYTVERGEQYSILSRALRHGADHFVLSDDKVSELAGIAVRLESHFGTPQDIEWAVDREDRIIILQSRPLGHFFVEQQSGSAADVETGRAPLPAGGISASRGVASGPVFIVRSNLDLLRFPQGAVLVVEHPLPDWATLLPRAVAVISETGQVAAHLATVAREFGIPALFGVKDAVSEFENDQVVTVDATACRIYEGKIDSLLAQPATKPDLMKGSPLHKVLSDVLRLITPLNLTDPSSLYFRPSTCETLHDLTRFCHEKAVHEMFSVSSGFHVAENSAKQLVGDAPFQWWVMDLDDGFSKSYDRYSKYIRVDQIVSIPMHALWEGMTAIPWKGPPPVSFKGFGSILFQSTMNRELDPAVRSGLANRSYFMISKNFCNFSVRLGYHFSLVEAHLSDLLTESYVNFQFKGGAADENRRYLRVYLLKDILEQFDFRVEQKFDALTARIEKKPMPFLTSRLKILGYLLIHTRQIDMVMGEQAMVEEYREKIVVDINSILAREPVPETGSNS